MSRHRLGFILLFVVAATLSACANKPSSEKLAEAILASTADDATSDVTPEEAICIAEELLDAGLSDTTMSGLAEDFANPQVLETEVNAVEPAVTAAAEACRE